MGPDRYGRTVGLIELDGISVNREMVKNGFARGYRQYCKIPDCRAWINDEEIARNARSGLWQDWFVAGWAARAAVGMAENAEEEILKKTIIDSDILF